MKEMSYGQLLSEMERLSEKLVSTCCDKGIRLATAESCTGGMISAAVTAVSGSSAVIELGVCSYSNRIKEKVLGVSAQTLKLYTEYSVQCAEEMARGVKAAASAQLGISTTGVAGPTGGTAEHPVGEVCIAVCTDKRCTADRTIYKKPQDESADVRDYVRAAAAVTALKTALEAAGEDY